MTEGDRMESWKQFYIATDERWMKNEHSHNNNSLWDKAPNRIMKKNK